LNQSISSLPSVPSEFAHKSAFKNMSIDDGQHGLSHSAPHGAIVSSNLILARIFYCWTCNCNIIDQR
jgi:hypothetical protein